jgi:hypothetical protein
MMSLFLALETGDLGEVLLYDISCIGFVLLFRALVCKMSLLSAMKACNVAKILLLPLLLLLGGYLQG